MSTAERRKARRIARGVCGLRGRVHGKAHAGGALRNSHRRGDCRGGVAAGKLNVHSAGGRIGVNGDGAS